ncbi:MAG: hypothetical protein CVV56_09235 [Tenericutes bacterium HGW-Tenericutes-1]|nr:MAG: hypothetical protein CVV56_09235 [Tenericutes bacterium HGW-Tenericutes-1]PKM93085.1 MAG: hypothetical protein CVU84_17650 [Firmicutes bacterium HGW-Firmicutes-1]
MEQHESTTIVLPIRLSERDKSKSRWPIEAEEHIFQQKELKACYAAKGILIDQLRPGDDFQPINFRIKSKPRTDFLWPTLMNPLVSEKVKNIFEENKVKGVSFFKIIVDKIEDKVAKYSFVVSDEVQVYYNMVINSSSKRPPGADIISICDLCGYELYNKEQRQIQMNLDMWLGEDIFYLNTTLHIIITEKVKNIIEQCGFNNIFAEEINQATENFA